MSRKTTYGRTLNPFPGHGRPSLALFSHCARLTIQAPPTQTAGWIQLGIYEPIEPLEKVEGVTILLRCFLWDTYCYCLNYNLIPPLSSTLITLLVHSQLTRTGIGNRVQGVGLLRSYNNKIHKFEGLCHYPVFVLSGTRRSRRFQLYVELRSLHRSYTTIMEISCLRMVKCLLQVQDEAWTKDARRKCGDILRYWVTHNLRDECKL